MGCTIKDIMEELNVSRGTVSKALNDKQGVSDDLRKKIKEKAKEMGYIPNSMAKRLSTRKSNTIGVFLLDRDKRKMKENFGIEFLDGIAKEAAKDNYDILFFTVTKDSSKKSKSYIDLCRERSVEGAIFIGLEEDDPNLEELRKSDIPISVIDITIKGKNVLEITSDNLDGIESGLNYFYKKGHRDIAFIKGTPTCEVAGIRYDRYAKFMKDLNNFRSDYIFNGDFRYEDGLKAADKIYKLEKRPTAVFCANDQMALGLIKGLNNKRIEVPEDISVIGFDNIIAGEHSNPALTTIGQDVMEIGREAFKGIFREDKSKVIVKPRLIIRESVI